MRTETRPVCVALQYLDFRNDAGVASEIGVKHNATALYALMFHWVNVN